MGGKSTIDITREEAIQAILKSMYTKALEDLSTSSLEALMYKLGIGDDIEKPYFGYNFNITD